MGCSRRVLCLCRSYCLENNVLEFFLNYLKNTGKDVQVQLLQTLAIMLQNLKNNAYIYYMLSQNHLNSLITHKFDFDDEELVGLYISLVKTIALKLDAQTVQFFFNKRVNDMPLLVRCSPCLRIHLRHGCFADTILARAD